MRTLLIAILLLAATAASGQTALITVKNTAPFDRQHETIALPLATVTGLLGEGDMTLLSVRKEGASVTLPIQVTPTAVLFQCDVRAHATGRFVLRYAPVREVPHPSVVSGLFAVPREDYAWENDRIAFRVYGPALAAEVNNGVDVWTKRVHYPIVYKWYKEAEGSAPGKDSYHQDKGEGADFFSVGGSLGAGGSGVWRDGKLYQPSVFSSWKTLADGPIRVAFKLTYVWHIGADTVFEERTISLDAGENLNRMEVRFLRQHGTSIVAAGLVKRANTMVSRDERTCIMSLWGPTTPDPLTGELGIAVVFPRGTSTGFAEDKDHYLILGAARGDAPLVYYAGAGWTGNGVITGNSDWSAYLVRFTERLASPLNVTIVRSK